MTLTLRFAGRTPLTGLTLFAVVAIGTPASATPPEPATTVRTPSASPPSTVPVVRHGRYTLVEVDSDAQPDLLQQVVEVSIPSTTSVTVGDALRYLLLYSGYRLCEPSQDTLKLYALPLPAAHLHLGPIVLRDGLLKLVGPAWHLSSDDATRQVCFTKRGAQP